MLRAAGLDEVGFRAVCPAYIDGGEDNRTLLVSFAKLHGTARAAVLMVRAFRQASGQIRVRRPAVYSRPAGQ